MSKMEARLLIPGQPATKKNSQVARCVNGKLVVLQSKAYRAYEKMALKALLACPRVEFLGPVVVTVHYWLKDKRRPDLNNLMAAAAWVFLVLLRIFVLVILASIDFHRRRLHSSDHG
jgi:Holliday junction resolvase RusA-like endonuclease